MTRTKISKSQSLFHQGYVSDWGANPHRLQRGAGSIVAIPFSSGLCFRRYTAVGSAEGKNILCRNPFFIRAMFQTWLTRDERLFYLVLSQSLFHQGYVSDPCLFNLLTLLYLNLGFGSSGKFRLISSLFLLYLTR